MKTILSDFKNNLSQAMIIFGFILLATIAAECRAAVYVCNDQVNCDKWTSITDEQSANNKNKANITVDQALSNSNSQIIQNGYGSIAGNNLYILKFWHKGGNLPLDNTYEHITVKVYKNESEYKGTCHVYESKVKEKYQTTC